MITWLYVRYALWWPRLNHDDVFEWKHFPHYRPFVRGIHLSLFIPLTKTSDAVLWYFFDLRLNKPLSKQSWGWWFETPSRPLWRHCDDCDLLCIFAVRFGSIWHLYIGFWKLTTEPVKQPSEWSHNRLFKSTRHLWYNHRQVKIIFPLANVQPETGVWISKYVDD